VLLDLVQTINNNATHPANDDGINIATNNEENSPTTAATVKPRNMPPMMAAVVCPKRFARSLLGETSITHPKAHGIGQNNPAHARTANIVPGVVTTPDKRNITQSPHIENIPTCLLPNTSLSFPTIIVPMTTPAA
jgi:hypothetical protein